ncbi:sensor histidine kinase [Dactylosporangium sp. NPDC051541]|uniref:sensor histidine kinase n=1 Tax=Dactylosporangium sp. NPDC051541 TaxID=3363977 RepID=UPI0037AA4C13
MYAWLRRSVPGLRVSRGDLLLALALSAATLWLAEDQVGDHPPGDHTVMVHSVKVPWTAPPEPEVDFFRPEPPSALDHWIAALNLLVTLPLAFRRRRPVIAFAAQFAGVFAATGGLTLFSLIALLIGAYTVAAMARRPAYALGMLAAGAAVAGVSFARNEPNLDVPSALAPFALLLPVGLAGIAIRAARLRAEASQQRAEALAREREQATRAAAAQERARIARELHDVVSHHVSMMTIQAGAATKILDSRPDLARGAMTAVESSGREAMHELRQLLGVLSPSAAEGGASPRAGVAVGGGPLAPQPGLAQMTSLVESVRDAGQPVRASVPDELELPVTIDLAAYRVAQEALTNALRYAPGARTSVRVEVDGDDLVVDVSNEAPASSPPGGAGTGSGLAGLAERVRLCGGTLAARPLVGGGFTVHARLPLRPDAAS